MDRRRYQQVQMKSLAIIHTTPLTIEVLKAIAREVMPEINLINILDDSILPQLAKSNGDLGIVEQRWINYVLGACDAGASAVMSACSSVGELVYKARPLVPVPVLRIDDPMAAEAVQRGQNIGVAATLPTTLGPTLRLVERKADQAGKAIHTETWLASEAYQRLMTGDPAGHDRILAAGLEQLGSKVDVVVLAQASMARVLPSLEPEIQGKFLTSPRSGMLQAQQVLHGLGD